MHYSKPGYESLWVLDHCCSCGLFVGARDVMNPVKFREGFSMALKELVAPVFLFCDRMCRACDTETLIRLASPILFRDTRSIGMENTCYRLHICYSYTHAACTHMLSCSTSVYNTVVQQKITSAVVPLLAVQLTVKAAVTELVCIYCARRLDRTCGAAGGTPLCNSCIGEAGAACGGCGGGVSCSCWCRAAAARAGCRCSSMGSLGCCGFGGGTLLC